MSIVQPESDLSLNIVVVGADIIDILKKENEPMVIEGVLKKFLSCDTRRTHNLFFDTMTYLFAIEIIREKNYKVQLIDYKKTSNLSLFFKK